MKKFILFLVIAFGLGIFCDFIFHKINITNFDSEFEEKKAKIENEYRIKEKFFINQFAEQEVKLIKIEKRFSKIDSTLISSDKQQENEKTKTITSYYKHNNMQSLFDSVDKKSGYIK